VYVYVASSQKQQSVGRHVAPREHFILIRNQPVFALTHQCRLFSGEATNTYIIIFGLTRSGIESTTYGTRGEHDNNYTTDIVTYI
jgi:hypothetical protein